MGRRSLHVICFTLEPAKGPSITSVTRSSNTIKISWKKLEVKDSNGLITNYEVYYQRASKNPNRKNVTGAESTTSLIGLRPNEEYTLAVRAFTKIGAGPLGPNEIVTTNESGEFAVIM